LGRGDRHGGTPVRPGLHRLQEEHYDFIVPKARLGRSAVEMFRDLLAEPTMQEQLKALGFRL
jgi:putative molybdopterin biosynthesis protein